MKNAITFIGLLFVATLGNAQALSAGDVAAYPKEMVSYTLDDSGDTLVKIMDYTCVISAEKSFANAREQAKWNRLKYDVKKAYPYAVLAKMKLAEMDAQLALVSGEKARKDFSEKCEKELTSQFSVDMKNLTYSQGKILFKLMDRETGSTTYQIIQERRGSFSAFMWQGVATIFGNNLKDDYDPSGDDANIEAVVQLIEMGVI